MRSELGVGTESFVKLREGNCYYVDKTAFLKPLIASGSDVLLITRPRRFGKSLFISTIESFLKVDPDHPGDASWQKQLFSGLKVLEDKAFCEQCMGRTPVLSITFKNAEGDSFESAYKKTAQMLFKTAKRHAYYLMDSPRLDEEDR